VIIMIRRLLFVGIIVLLVIAAFRCLAAPEEKSNVAMLLNEEMYSIPGKEVAIQRAEYPPGWVGERHYHTGDIFVYVLEGQFVIDVDGQDRITIDPGEVYHEAVNKVMQARNPSATRPTKLILFQVGDKGKPRVILSN
jgi:quercetin dioxygenase-like cupin family protein